MVELGVQPLREFILATFGADCQLHMMAVFDNCSSVMIFNNIQIFMDKIFSAAAAKIRNSSGAHAIKKKATLMALESPCLMSLRLSTSFPIAAS